VTNVPLERRSPLGNTSSLLLARIGIAALGWAGTTLIVRSLNESDWGRFSFVFSLLALTSVLTDLGVGRIALAEVLPGRPNRARAAGTYLIIRSALGIAGYCSVVLFVILGGYDPAIVQATAIGGTILVFNTVIGAWNIAFQAAERMDHVAISSVVAQLGQLGLVVAIAVRGGPLIWFVIAAVLKDLFLLPWRALRARELLEVEWSLDRDLAKRMMREAVPLSAGLILQTAVWRVDTIMLSKLATLADVGSYGVAYKFADLAHALPMAMSAALLAPLVRAWSEDLETFRRIFARAGQILMVAAGFAVVQMGLFASDLIRLFFTDVYADAAGPAQLLVLAEAAAFPTALAFTTLIAAGRLVAYPLVAAVGLLLNLVLNLELIPDHGYAGAATATLITEVAIAGALLVVAGRLPTLAGVVGFDLHRVVPVCTVAFVGGLLLEWGGMPWPASMAIVSLVFAAGSVKAGYVLRVQDLLRL